MHENYSPLRYPGGKAKLTDFLIQVMHANKLREPHYVEPYAGGAGAALRLLFEEYVSGITINDADPRIRSFWGSVTDENDEFIDLVRRAPLTVDEWRLQRAIYDNPAGFTTLQVGFATFYLNRTTRSGIIHNGGPIGGFDQTGNYLIDVRYNREQLARRIQRIGIYADRIQVSGHDGLELLHAIEEDPWANQTFVYLDPPYYVKGSELYLNRLEHNEHAALAAYMQGERAFPWVMTYDNVDPVRALYVDLPQRSFSLSYSAYERREGEELLIHPPSITIPAAALESLPLAA